MNEEELFCKLFPEYAVNGKPLSPYIDLFESGYEQAEKRIAELEKRCANYEMNISKMEKGTCDICKETKKDKKILELEKENAELKHIIATLRQEKDNVSMHAKAMEVVAKTRSDQLTKAKEIIKDLLGSENTSCEKEMFFEIRQKAEQFLSEVEK